ncbi:hypothetical protein QJQ45_004171 [Haematococcus lacustris]|nr:hypothetical protein QJQ45_004171 [Haematococcus lacustris]
MLCSQRAAGASGRIQKCNRVLPAYRNKPLLSVTLCQRSTLLCRASPSPAAPGPVSKEPIKDKQAAAAASAAAASPRLPIPSTEAGKLISKTEIAAFIQRDDMMDQMVLWANIEAREGGIRNFGLPMDVEPFYRTVGDSSMLWGFKVGIFKEGNKLCDLGILFDQDPVTKHEWVGRGDDGFPVLEGKTEEVRGKHLEIW